MTTIRLFFTFVRVQGLRATDVLAATAFAVATAVLLIVVGGILAFRDRFLASSTTDSEFLVNLAMLAGALLLPAVVTLAQAAVRLAVARRDARLAVLRLIGATKGQVGFLAVADAAIQALAGALVGALLALALTPLVSLIPFQGRGFTIGELIAPFGVQLAAVAGVLAIAIVSALVSLRRVQLTPLGVAQRVQAKRPSWMRIVIWVALLVGYFVVVGVGIIPVGIGVMLALLAIAVLAVLLIGPLFLSLGALILAKTARHPATLIAARRLLDDPRSAFNVVGAMSIAVVIGGFTSLLPPLSNVMEGTLPQDLATGSLLTIAIAAVLGAVLAGVAQSAKVLDQQAEYRALTLLGTELRTLRQARMRGMAIPVVTMIGGATATMLVLLTPMLNLWLTSPSSILLWFATTVASALLIFAATAASTPLLKSVVR